LPALHSFCNWALAVALEELALVVLLVVEAVLTVTDSLLMVVLICSQDVEHF
jgi:hypothetical protein